MQTNTQKKGSYGWIGNVFLISVIVVIVIHFWPIDCTKCQGFGRIQCYTCSGGRQVKCSDCKEINFIWFNCARCNGTESHKCYTCNGCGELTCYRCQGKGNDPKKDIPVPPLPQPPKLPPYIVYIYGWQPCFELDGSVVWKSDTEEAVEEATRILQETFPDSQIKHWGWSASSDLLSFKEIFNMSSSEANRLANDILVLSNVERENIILVGHSLGGRIVIKTMAQLYGYNKRIRAGYFLGAAIPQNDSDIYFAINNSLESNINIYNSSDRILQFGFFLSTGHYALGYSGYTSQYPIDGKLQQYDHSRGELHGSKYYLDFLKNALKR